MVWLNKPIVWLFEYTLDLTITMHQFKKIYEKDFLNQMCLNKLKCLENKIFEKEKFGLSFP